MKSSNIIWSSAFIISLATGCQIPSNTKNSDTGPANGNANGSLANCYEFQDTADWHVNAGGSYKGDMIDQTGTSTIIGLGSAHSVKLEYENLNLIQDGGLKDKIKGAIIQTAINKYFDVQTFELASEAELATMPESFGRLKCIAYLVKKLEFNGTVISFEPAAPLLAVPNLSLGSVDEIFNSGDLKLENIKMTILESGDPKNIKKGTSAIGSVDINAETAGTSVNLYFLADFKNGADSILGKISSTVDTASKKVSQQNYDWTLSDKVKVKLNAARQ